MKRIFWVAIFWALSVAAAVFPAAALTNCTVGQQVSDPLGGNGIVDWSGGGFCRVKYDGGVSHGWTAASLRAVEAPTKPNIGVRNSSSSAAPDAGPKEAGDGVILKPAPKTLVYRAGPPRHFLLTPTVNRAPIRGIVGTRGTV